MHRAFDRLYRRRIGGVPIVERFNLVLRDIVIADRGRIFPDDYDLAHLAR